MKLKKNEGQEQELIFQWAKLHYGKYPELARCMFAIPNGGTRIKKEAWALKRQGVKAGVSDITIQVPRGGYHGLWLELKVKPNKATEEQIKFLEAMKEQGYYTVIAYGALEAVDVIKRYMES